MISTTAIGYQDNLPASTEDSLIERTVEAPAPGPHDLLVEVAAVSVNPVDVKLRAGAPSGGFRVLGFDAAGVVRAVGEQVTLFQPGDEVFLHKEGQQKRRNDHQDRQRTHAPPVQGELRGEIHQPDGHGFR